MALAELKEPLVIDSTGVRWRNIKWNEHFDLSIEIEKDTAQLFLLEREGNGNHKTEAFEILNLFLDQLNKLRRLAGDGGRFVFVDVLSSGHLFTFRKSFLNKVEELFEYARTFKDYSSEKFLSLDCGNYLIATSEKGRAYTDSSYFQRKMWFEIVGSPYLIVSLVLHRFE